MVELSGRLKPSVESEFLIISDLRKYNLIENVTDVHYNALLVKTKPNASFPQIQELIRKLQKDNLQISR